LTLARIFGIRVCVNWSWLVVFARTPGRLGASPASRVTGYLKRAD
jgi:hypothetical protein